MSTHKAKSCDITVDDEARNATDHGLLAYSMGPQQVIKQFNLASFSPNNVTKMEKLLEFLGQKYQELAEQGNLGECKEIILDMIAADREFEKILRKREQKGGTNSTKTIKNKNKNKKQYGGSSCSIPSSGGDIVGATDLGRQAFEQSAQTLFNNMRIGDNLTADQRKQIMKLLDFLGRRYGMLIENQNETSTTCNNIIDAMVDAYKQYINIVGY